jgi:ankyrin repeat protein
MNLADNDLLTPLNIACDNGRVEVVKYLLQQPTISLSINKKDKWNDSPFDTATKQNHTEIVRLLTAAGAQKSAQ